MLKIYQLRLSQNTFEATFKYRGVGVRVAFVDGNTYNGTPAKCYTNDPFKQRAIENSQMFKSQDIVLERQVEEESDRQKPVQVAQKPVDAEPAQKPADAVPAQPADTGGEELTFDNLAEAILYVATNYGIQVQTANDVRKFLRDKGINAHIRQG